MEYTDREISIEICNRLNINLKGKTSGNVFVTCLNPNHIDRSPTNCSISLDKGLYHCFACGASGSLKNLYYETFHVSIYKDLGIKRDFSFSSLKKEEIIEDFNSLPETDFKLTGNFFQMDSTDLGKKWMNSRGFDIQLMNKLGVRYMKNGRTVKKSDPDNKEFWRFYTDCAMIPIYEKGQLLCFEARTLRNKEEWKQWLQSKNKWNDDLIYKKVLYPKNGSTKTLYKLDYLDTNKKLYIVEGLMDLFALKTNEIFENSTTTFGRSVKERQFYQLSKFKEIVLIPNLDEPGLLALEQYKNRNLNISVLLLPKGINDVNEIIQKKNPRFNSIQDLLNMNWLDTVRKLNDIDIQALIKAYC